MATQPTQRPVPSEKPQDLKFNAGKIDEFVTSMGWTYTDRFGNKHYTIAGINYLAQQVMNAFGYITLTGVDFDTGATVSTPNEVLFNPADNSYYKWTGSFAVGGKVIPQDSTPESTGGIGPGKWLSVGDTILRSDLKKSTGATIIGTTSGNSVQGVFDSLLNDSVFISSFGLSETDHAFNATQLDLKLRETELLGVSNIIVDKEYEFDEGYDYATGAYARRVGKLTNFKFTGTHSLKGVIESPVVYSDPVSNPVLVNGSNIVIKSKLPGEPVTVVMFGDSISAEWANSNALGITQWEIIKAEMRRQNPGVDFDFINRAIGGQTWINANTKPTYFPPEWYADQSKDWVYYIVDPVPDIIIFAFGMNDSTSFNFGTMASTINKLKGALPDSSFVMIPCLLPSRASDYSDGFGFDGYKYQQGRNFAAGAERTYAEYLKMSVWDLNRYFVMCRDGLDVTAGELQEVNPVLTSGAYRADPCIDFSFESWIDSWDVSKPIYINCGGDEEDEIFIGSSDGKFSVTAKTEYINTYFSVTTSAVAIPSTGFWLTVTVMNNECVIYCSNDATSPVTDHSGNVLIASFKLVRHGGIVRPAIGYAGYVSGPITSMRAMIGKPRIVNKTITDTLMWGKGADNPDTQKPFGGNGINHPSAQGLQRVVAPVMESQDLLLKYEAVKLTIQLLSGTSVVNGPVYATVNNGVLYLSGVISSAIVNGTPIAKIVGFDRLNLAGDVLAGTLGTTSGWQSCILRLKPNGDIVVEVGGVASGLLLNGVNIAL